MSLFKCIHKCLFRGMSIRKDSVLDITESEADMSVVKSSFVRIDNEPVKVEKPGAGNDFTREQYMQKLDALGVHYKVRASLAELKELHALAVDNSINSGNDAEAKAKAEAEAKAKAEAEAKAKAEAEAKAKADAEA